MSKEMRALNEHIEREILSEINSLHREGDAERDAEKKRLFYAEAGKWSRILDSVRACKTAEEIHGLLYDE